VRLCIHLSASSTDHISHSGQDTFISHVDSLPTSLLRPSSAPSSPSSSSSSTLDLLPTNSFQFPSITFLSRYRDFLALYSLASQQTDFEETYRLKRQSAELLILLLTSGMAPKAFWAVMLLDSIGLLESEHLVSSLDWCIADRISGLISSSTTSRIFSGDV